MRTLLTYRSAVLTAVVAASTLVSSPSETTRRGALHYDRGATAPPCSMTVASTRRIALADGQVVHLAVGSPARQGRTLLMAGVPTLTWAPDAKHGAAPRTRDSLVAVLISDAQEARGVANPLVGRSITHVKVANGGDGAWHALLTERLTAREGHAQVTDSARVWYGRFDGRGWSDVAPVVVVHGAYTAGPYTSDLVVGNDGQLAFAVPIDARVGSAAVTGLILARRDVGRWSFDTLGGLIDPRYARLLPGPGPKEWTALYIAPFFDSQRLVNASLHGAVWRGRWSAPHVVVRAFERALLDPTAVSTRAGMVVTWSRRAERTDSATTPRIEWALTSPDGRITRQPRSPIVIGSNDYRAVALGADSVIWFARDGLAPARVRVAVFDGTSVSELGLLAIRNETWLAAHPLDDGDIAVVTSEVGSRPSDFPAVSVLRIVRPVCRGRTAGR